MLITREVDYALRILRVLSDGQQRSVVEICDVEGTPKQFAYKITKKLEKYGWITIARGVEGGCKLTVNLKDISLYELICLIDDDRFVIGCLSPNYECSYRALGHKNCAVHDNLHKIQKSIEEQLKTYSIFDMMRA